MFSAKKLRIGPPREERMLRQLPWYIPMRAKDSIISRSCPKQFKEVKWTPNLQDGSAAYDEKWDKKSDPKISGEFQGNEWEKKNNQTLEKKQRSDAKPGENW